MRAVAALLVVFQHAYYTACVSRGEIYSNEFPVNYGRLGVVLFFSISGFVIALNRKRSIKEFVTHRLLRIFPGYWLAIALTFPFYCFPPHQMHVSLEAALLWPSAQDSGLPIPYWTLVFEVFFYFVATVLFSSRLGDRALTVIAVAWIAAINVCQHNPIDGSDFCFPGFWIGLSPIMQVLPMGFLCSLHFGMLAKVNRGIFAAAAVVAYATSFFFPDFTVLRHLFLGASTTLLLAAVADMNILNKATRIMGNASYGIYLIHFPVMVLVFPLLPKMPTALAIAVFMTIGTGLGLLFGIFDYWVYRQNTKRILSI